MIISMTGFGRATAEGEWGSLSVEISSVNHRFQEVTTRLPRELSGFDHLVEKDVRSAFGRGKVLLRSQLFWASRFRTAEIRADVAESYFHGIEKLRSHLHLLDEPRIDSLLNLPGVLEGGEGAQSAIMEQVGEALRKATAEALVRWNEMRRLEGDHLRDDIVRHLEEFASHVRKIAEGWPALRDGALAAAAARISTLVAEAGARVDEGRLAQEVAILADRWDIAEEISRSESHLVKFRSILEEEGAVGRKIDFLLQEMNREINTIASKVGDAAIRWVAVEAKTVLERIREQIQNVE